VMAGLRSGDDAAETLVFRRFAPRLIALAARQPDAWMLDRSDVEDAVVSACASFFLRNRRGELRIATWDDLWSLLALITVRTCDKHRRYRHAARRDAAREVSLSWTQASDATAWLPDRAPSPEENAILNETIEQLFRALKPDDRPIVDQLLM